MRKPRPDMFSMLIGFLAGTLVTIFGLAIECIKKL